MNILLDFLIDTHSLEQDKRIRLKPNKQDKEHFENLFTGNTSNINSNIVNNYDFFLKKISAETLTTGQIYESFKKLTMVLITLDRGQDEPQLIFESLNSTGVDLTAGDLVRNYILMDLEPFEQERMYKNYWVKIENLTGDIAEFVRNYLMFKLKVWVKKADAYPVFKNFSIVQYNKNKESILQDLLSFAEIFSWFVQIKKHQNNNINRQLARLKRLEFTVCYPYLFDVFNDVKSGNIDEETAKNVLVLIESYAFRKIIVDNTTQGLNKLFISLGKDIKKEQYWNEQYLNILCFILLGKRVSQRFPNDEEFENALINKEVYRLQVKNRNFLLGSLENYKSAYAVNLDELTVEHIMPQTLTNEWKKNWERIGKIHTKNIYIH